MDSPDSLAQMRRPLGALLVAPPEVDHDPLDPRIATFGPTPAERLPFPSILVGSHDDPFMSLASTGALARRWGCRFADAGPAGHINARSGLGDWAFGQALLRQLVEPCAPSCPGGGHCTTEAARFTAHP